jgi:acid phosphatase type 7
MGDLISSAESGVYDTVLHVGDWAYNMEDGASSTGNQFMNDIQGYAAIKPVMPAPGNHEACELCLGVPVLEHSNDNFTQYRSRLHSVTLYAGANAGTNSNIFYSFNQGLVHFLVYSAEAYAYKSGAELIANQKAFMKADLAAVDRSVTPWVVGLVHKDWTMEAEAYADFSPILEDGGVDLQFVGHVHYYNRYYPINPVTGDIDKASVSADGSTYTNPKFLVNVVTGASGDREDDDKCKSGDANSYTCSENYGWGVFQALNATHATWNFHTVRADGAGPADYSDSLTIVQMNHGPRQASA